MTYLEKKYRVSDFHQIIALLEAANASKKPTVHTTHYYADTATNNVVKMVVDKKTVHIHYLVEQNGLFKLTRKISVATKGKGFSLLREEGFQQFQTVTITIKKEQSAYICSMNV